MSLLLEADLPAVTPTDAPHAIPRVQGWVTPAHLMMVAGFCLLFLYHNYLPLFHSDLWGHVAYGEWILTQRQLPTVDPFAELATGVPVWATAWLGQVIFALTDRALPLEGLAHLFALVVLATSLVMTAACFERAQRADVAVMAAVLAFGIAWSRHAVQRPEIFGQLGCAVLLLLLARWGWLGDRTSLFTRTQSTRRWVLVLGMTGLFTLWANLHGSFIVGLGILCIVACGRLIDRWRVTQSWQAVWCSPQSQGEWFVCEAAVLGCCLNPYGIDLLVQTLAFPTHPNLNSVLEWYPLEMVSLEGLPMALSWLLTALVLRKSRREFSSAEVLLLVALNLAVMLRVRMIAWYAPVWAVVIAPHLADLLQRGTTGFTLPKWFQQRSLGSTALAILCVWLTFALSPISRPVLGGTPRPITQLLSHQTPLGATQWLLKHPPEGLVFAPQWWGDWLAWRGPPGLRVMATTNAIHLLPSQCWQDYLCISVAEAGWSDRLDRYRINTLVVSRELQPELDRSLERSSEWQSVYQDALSRIYVRKSLLEIDQSSAMVTRNELRERP